MMMNQINRDRFSRGCESTFTIQVNALPWNLFQNSLED